MIISNKDKTNYVNSNNITQFHIKKVDITKVTYKLYVHLLGEEKPIELNVYDTAEEAHECIVDIFSCISANNKDYYEII